MADNKIFTEPIPWQIDEDGMLLLGDNNQRVVFNCGLGDRTLDEESAGKPPYGLYGAMPWAEYASEIKGVKCVGDIECTGGSFFSMFSKLPNVESIDISRMDMSKAVNLRNMFYDCPKLQTVVLPSKMEGEAKYCDSMFADCESLEKIENLDELRKIKVLDIESMFSYCKSLKSLDLSGLDVSDTTSMVGLFAGCDSLENVKLKGWNTEKVSDMSGMFGQCHSLGDVDISHFDTSNLRRTVAMFDECSNLEIVYLPRGNNEALRMADDMFSGCESLTSDISYFDLSAAESIDDILENCNSKFVRDNMPALQASYDSGKMLVINGLSDDVFKNSFNPMVTGLELDGFSVAIPRIAVHSQEDGTKSVSLIKDKLYPGRDSEGYKNHYSGREIVDAVNEEIQLSKALYSSVNSVDDINVDKDIDVPDL